MSQEFEVSVPICTECGDVKSSPYGLTCDKWGCFGKVKRASGTVEVNDE